MFVMLRISSWMPSSFQRTVHVLTYIDCFARFVLKKKGEHQRVVFSTSDVYFPCFLVFDSFVSLHTVNEWVFCLWEIHADNQTWASEKKKEKVSGCGRSFLSVSLTLMRPFCFLGCSTCAMFTSHLSLCVCVCVRLHLFLFTIVSCHRSKSTKPDVVLS